MATNPATESWVRERERALHSSTRSQPRHLHQAVVWKATKCGVITSTRSQPQHLHQAVVWKATKCGLITRPCPVNLKFIHVVADLHCVCVCVCVSPWPHAHCTVCPQLSHLTTRPYNIDHDNCVHTLACNHGHLDLAGLLIIIFTDQLSCGSGFLNLLFFQFSAIFIYFYFSCYCVVSSHLLKYSWRAVFKIIYSVSSTKIYEYNSGRYL